MERLIVNDMKTYAFCPVSERRINEKVARFNAVITVIALILFGITQHIALIVLLSADFFLRTSRWTHLSPIAFLSRKIVNLLDIPHKLINAGPKIFAARIGLVFSAIIAILLLLNLTTIAIVFTTILLVFSFLEGAFGICVACILYPHIYKIAYQKIYKG